MPIPKIAIAESPPEVCISGVSDKARAQVAKENPARSQELALLLCATSGAEMRCRSPVSAATPVQVATAQLANIEVQGALGDGIEAE